MIFIDWDFNGVKWKVCKRSWNNPWENRRIYSKEIKKNFVNSKWDCISEWKEW